MFKRSDEIRKQLYLTVVKVDKNEEGCRIFLEPDPPIFISASDRKAISDPNGEYAKKGLWHWAAGGALVIYHQGGQKFLALILRDSGAPSFGGHLTLASGLSSTYEEFFNPTFVAIREGIEEVAVTVNGRIVIPLLGLAFEEMNWNTFEKQLTRAKKFDWFKVDEHPLYADTEFVQTDEQKLEIVHGKRVSRHQGIICFDPKTRGIDLLKIIEIELPGSKDIVFFDCEDTKTGPIDREILIFPLEQIKTLELEQEGPLKICGATTRFKSGKSVSFDPEKYFPCTPVLKEALRAILPK